MSAVCIFYDSQASVPLFISKNTATLMTNLFLQAEFTDLMLRFALNASASLTLVFGLYYRRYRDKELAISAALFNLFIFCVLTALSQVNFSLAAGFGLFAILAMFTLRSEPLGKTEITYFFGSVAVAVICSVKGLPLPLIAGLAAIVVVGTWAIDHPRVLESVHSIRVTLDKIDHEALSNPETMKTALTKRLGVEVMSYQFTTLDFVNDTARISVFYRKG